MSLVLAISFFDQPALAQAPIHEKQAETVVLSVPELAHAAALRHGLNAATFVLVMQKESNNWENAQSHVVHTGGPNGREDSWGDCQIHLPAHPDISKEQALTPAWCFEWSARQWELGHAYLWTEWRNLQ